MDKIIFCLCLICLFFSTESILPEAIQKELLDKLMNKIDLEDIYNFNYEDLEYQNFKPQKFLYEQVEDNIKYNKSKIDEILKKYNFPQNFNFLEEHNITANVKNQARCGSCWSFSATSALAYRYKYIYDIDVDLSPQDGLSCLTGTCETGYAILDTQMNLVKNGSVTEQCFPYSSADGGKPEECRDDIGKCKDESVEFKKYKAKNLYTSFNSYEEKYFYDFVTIIIDQLLTKGPVVSQITVYKDFPRVRNITNDTIYTFNGSAQYDGEHAIVITGYGYSEEENKYYWIIQNSWGKDWYNNGFIRLEFGQVGAERIAFSEPYNPQEDSNITNINVNSLYIDEFCDIYINIANYTYKDMDNTLELTYQKSNSNEELYYYCNILPGEKSVSENQTLSCYITQDNLLYNTKGKYELINSTSLEKENNFIK